ncbi:nuclear transport factor 2 family protein [Flavobacterium sp. GCM10023249]|uniref:nuclear transport factor 2 family protein n=1 Tax=unclassified Flavobacterium TaxID=196869 RepID=UPI003616026C
MRLTFIFLLSFLSISLFAQKPCESNSKYNEFDFWIGEWEVYGPKGIVGHSKISKILDNCIILEEWVSANSQQGLIFSGKSYNTYNAASGQWQQTWVDNTGGTTEYLTGKFENNSMQFLSRPFNNGKNSSIRRLTFFKLENGYVRQLGEISNDEGKNFSTEYDLEYRKKKTSEQEEILTLLKEMESNYNKGNFEGIADYYSKKGKIIGRNTEFSGEVELKKYWKSFENLGGTWKLTNLSFEPINETIWQKGISEIKDKHNKVHKVNFTLVFIKENNRWKILQDSYW